MRLYLRDVALDRQAADVISRLGDEPYKRASRRSVTPEMNIDELFQELRDLFEDFDLRDEVFESLRDRKRLPGESVRDYVAVVEELVGKAVPQVSRVERSQLSTWFVLSGLRQGSLVAKYDRFWDDASVVRLQHAMMEARTGPALLVASIQPGYGRCTREIVVQADASYMSPSFPSSSPSTQKRSRGGWRDHGRGKFNSNSYHMQTPVNETDVGQAECIILPNYICSIQPKATFSVYVNIHGLRRQFLIDSGAGISIFNPAGSKAKQLAETRISPVPVKLRINPFHLQGGPAL